MNFQIKTFFQSQIRTGREEWFNPRLPAQVRSGAACLSPPRSNNYSPVTPSLFRVAPARFTGTLLSLISDSPALVTVYGNASFWTSCPRHAARDRAGRGRGAAPSHKWNRRSASVLTQSRLPAMSNSWRENKRLALDSFPTWMDCFHWSHSVNVNC